MSATDMQRLVGILHDGNHSLAVESHGETRTFDGRGVADLHALYTGGHVLRGALVADKVVGKGAAALMIAGGVAAVHADVISEAALGLFGRYAVEVSYGALVPAIINRSGNGVCPVESLCSSCATADECIPLISEFLIRMKSCKR